MASPTTPPVALPAKIGDPSLIKHVFLIVRENRTYDQILGDVAAGNGDPSLAVFGDGSAAGGTPVTPNAHMRVKRFPLLDNFYDPSRQSADGHQWIQEAMAPYADDIQSPDWVRSYPGGNAGDALAYQKKGFLFSEAEAAGLPVKIYGEYVENDTVPTAGRVVRADQRTELEPVLRRLAVLRGRACLRSAWDPGREDAVLPEHDPGRVLYPGRVPSYMVKNFPYFDLGIPDQFRVDLWVQDFNNDVANGTVPAMEHPVDHGRPHHRPADPAGRTSR